MLFTFAFTARFSLYIKMLKQVAKHLNDFSFTLSQTV